MIEPAREDDGPEILLLTANAGVFKPTEVAAVAEIWSDYLSEGAQGSGYYMLVYREAGELLGYACYGPHPLTEGTFDLYWIAVDRAHRLGQKIFHRSFLLETRFPPFHPAYRHFSAPPL